VQRGQEEGGCGDDGRPACLGGRKLDEGSVLWAPAPPKRMMKWVTDAPWRQYPTNRTEFLVALVVEQFQHP